VQRKDHLDGAVKDGIIFDWTKKKEYVDMVPNWIKWTNSSDAVRRQLVFDDGNLMPVFTPIADRNGTYQGLAIRQDWLDRQSAGFQDYQRPDGA
jgi:hypothetical protein